MTSEQELKPICEDHVIKGRRLSNRIRKKVKAEVEKLVETHRVSPKLVTVIVGEDPGSQMYVRMKHKASNKVESYLTTTTFPRALHKKSFSI